MKFILFAEGHTEKRALPAFLKRWLDPRLREPVGLKVVRFEGWADYLHDIAKKVALHLDPPEGQDVIAAIGLIDLYGPTIYPSSHTSVAQRLSWGQAHFNSLVGNARFHQHFAVHETEAWLFSEPHIFPVNLPAGCTNPETIDSNRPPARLLNELYRTQLKRPYKKVVDGFNLFSRLAPDVAADRCPYLNLLLQDMLASARSAGL